MSPLRLSLRAPPDQRLDLSALTPDRLAGLDVADIEKLPVQTTRRPAVAGDWFTVQAGDPQHIVIEGGSPRLDCVGTAMRTGRLEVSGDVGEFAGRQMAGGRLVIGGHAGNFAASGLRGGTLEIKGNAGSDLAAPLAGERTGMRGGIVLVAGKAGERVGDRLRRGLIVIDGDADAFAGSRMVAGTLIICGSAGALPGILMRRGTIVIGAAANLAPTFVATAQVDLVFTRLLASALHSLNARAANLVMAATKRYAGDTAVFGKGELFTL